MTPFWDVIVGLVIIAAIINLCIAVTKRKTPILALVRTLAALISLGLAAGIVIGKIIRIAHPYLQVSYVFIAFGVFIAIVFLLPSYIERNNAGEEQAPTIQQRAARPANATIRLRDANTDEWVN